MTRGTVELAHVFSATVIKLVVFPFNTFVHRYHTDPSGGIVHHVDIARFTGNGPPQTGSVERVAVGRLDGSFLSGVPLGKRETVKDGSCFEGPKLS